MTDAQDLVRAMSADEVAALGPLPDPDTEDPTTDRDERPSAMTAEVHSPGVLPSAPSAQYDAGGFDPFPAPRSLSEED
jgi:hypothetical protein